MLDISLLFHSMQFVFIYFELWELKGFSAEHLVIYCKKKREDIDRLSI